MGVERKISSRKAFFVGKGKGTRLPLFVVTKGKRNVVQDNASLKCRKEARKSFFLYEYGSSGRHCASRAPKDLSGVDRNGRFSGARRLQSTGA